jgi:isopentenyl diphosphate isomerase/L-lactate dehydrogenase-like FMN-dependent dehydrogenase
MNTNNNTNKVPTRFGRQTRFRLKPRVLSAIDETQAQFELLRTRLVQPLLTETTDVILRRQLRLAANEAAAVAWTTPFPLLVLPVLLEEKSEEAQQYSRRQAEVLDSSNLLNTAAL